MLYVASVLAVVAYTVQSMELTSSGPLLSDNTFIHIVRKINIA